MAEFRHPATEVARDRGRTDIYGTGILLRLEIRAARRLEYRAGGVADDWTTGYDRLWQINSGG